MGLRIGIAVMLVAVVCAAALRGPTLTPNIAFAAGTLDQSQLTGSGPFAAGAGVHMGQVFTPGLSGGIDQVDLSLGNLISSTDTVTLEIRNVVSGVPGTTVLGSTTFSASTIPIAQATYSFPITPPAPVTAGTPYVVLLRGGIAATPIIWYGAFGNPYAGGTLVISPDQGATWMVDSTADLIFATYVSPFATVTPTSTATSTVTLTPTSTVTPSVTLTPTATSTSLPGATATATATSSPGGVSTATATAATTATATTTATAATTVTATATVPARSVSPGDDDDDKGGRTRTREQRQQEQHTNQGNRDDVYTEGGVVEVGTDSQGSFAVIGNRDGVMIIRLNCRNQCPTIRPGDYIQVEGVKESEGLFYADEVSVSR